MEEFYRAHFSVEKMERHFYTLAKRHGMVWRVYLWKPPIAADSVYYRHGIGIDEAIVTAKNRGVRDAFVDALFEKSGIVTIYKLEIRNGRLVLSEYFVRSPGIEYIGIHSGKPEGKVLATFDRRDGKERAEFFDGFWPCPNGFELF